MRTLKELKEDIKNIAKEMTEIVSKKFKPVIKDLEKENPKLFEAMSEATEMSIVLYFLEEAVEHWVDEGDVGNVTRRDAKKIR